MEFRVRPQGHLAVVDHVQDHKAALAGRHGVALLYFHAFAEEAQRAAVLAGGRRAVRVQDRPGRRACDRHAARHQNKAQRSDGWSNWTHHGHNPRRYPDFRLKNPINFININIF